METFLTSNSPKWEPSQQAHLLRPLRTLTSLSRSYITTLKGMC
jgi:hypothetical protein